MNLQTQILSQSQSLSVTLTADDHSVTYAGSDIAAELLDRYGQRCVHYAQALYADAAAAFFAQWSRFISARLPEFSRIYSATAAEYSVLDDYAETRQEILTHGHSAATEHGHTVANSGTRTREMEYDSTMQHDITTFDSIAYRADTQDVHTGTDTSTTTDDLTTEHSGTDTTRHTGKDQTDTTVSGYKSAPTDRIRQEVDLRSELDICDMIIDSFARRYLFM